MSWEAISKAIDKNNIKLIAGPSFLNSRKIVLNTILSGICPSALDKCSAPFAALALLKADKICKRYSSIQYRYLSYSQAPLYEISVMDTTYRFGYFNSLPNDDATDLAIKRITELFNPTTSILHRLSIHIRRGDYSAHGMLLTPLQHYLDSIKVFDDSLQSSKTYPITIFTDSPNDPSVLQIKQIFQDRVFLSDSECPIDIILQLSSSSHLVGSNSSLSLWASLISSGQISSFPSLWLNSPLIESQNVFGQYISLPNSTGFNSLV